MEDKKVRTIYDLAQLVGVSAATVSRALAGKGVVNTKTADRINELARQHGFRPSVSARNLRTQRHGAIGVIIPLGHERGQHVSDPFFMTMIGHLADHLTERGYDLVLSRVIPNRDDWLEAIIEANRVDGLIIIGQSDQSSVLDAAASIYLPLVAWGAYSHGQVHCSVGSDNFLGGHLATKHLIDRGCRRIAFFGHARGVEIAHRIEGARQAIADTGEEVELLETPTHLATELSGVDIAAFFETTRDLPDGIFAASDMVALTAIQVLTGLGRSVPEDVRVIGYDDLMVARTSVPALTTIRQDLAGGAAQLIDCLFKRIDGKMAGSVVLDPELVVRSST